MYERISISDHVRDSVRPVGFVVDESVLLPFLVQTQSTRREAIHFHFKTNLQPKFLQTMLLSAGLKSFVVIICNKGLGPSMGLGPSVISPSESLQVSFEFSR
jgi:hypothetical protein